MGIFNRKLLGLLIFINCFNNIYIFCNNGVEVKEVGDLQSAKDSDRPIDSFINDYKNTQESDDESTEESDEESTQESAGENHIDGDKNQIIVQNSTENSPIIKEEQDQDKEAGEITNWIKKNIILFTFLSIMTLIGGLLGIKSLVQGLFGKKNEMEGAQGGDGENFAGMFGNHHQGDNQDQINQNELIVSKDDSDRDDQKEEKKIQTINLFTKEIKNEKILEMIQNNQDKNKDHQELLKQYDMKDLKDKLDFTLPTIEYFNEVIETNQESINLLNTTFSIIKDFGDWKEWKEINLNQRDKDLLNFYLHEDFIPSNTISQYFLSELNKMYYNKKDDIIILVELNKIKAVINKKNKFFISISSLGPLIPIRLHFNNVFFEIDIDLNYCKKYQILKNISTKKKYLQTINIYYAYKKNKPIDLLDAKFYIDKDAEDLKNVNSDGIDENIFNSQIIAIKTHIINKCKEIQREAKKRL